MTPVEIRGVLEAARVECAELRVETAAEVYFGSVRRIDGDRLVLMPRGYTRIREGRPEYISVDAIERVRRSA